MGTKMRILDDSQCDHKNCKHLSHATSLSREDFKLAQEVPMPERLTLKVKRVLEENESNLNEGNKYLIAGLIFFIINIVSIFFTKNILWIVSLLGFLAMYYFYYEVNKDVTRNQGFVDGVFMAQAETARGMREFIDEVESGKEDVPDVVKDIIMQRKSDIEETNRL